MACICRKKVEKLANKKVNCTSCGQYVHADCYKLDEDEIATFKCMLCTNNRRKSIVNSPPIRAISATTTNVTTVTTSIAGTTTTMPLDEQRVLFSKQLEEQRMIFSEQLKSIEERIIQRFSDVAADLSKFSVNVKSLTAQVSYLDKQSVSASKEIELLKANVSVLENNAVAADVVIFNVPNDLDSSDVVSKLLNTLSCSVQPCNVFRISNKKSDSSKCVPIILKLQSSSDRATVFRAVAEFRATLRLLRATMRMVIDDGLGPADVMVHKHRALVRVLSKLHKGLKIFHLNAWSLNGTKLDYARYIFECKDADIICVSETCFKPGVSDCYYSIPNYKLFRNDRVRRKGGGVAIYCTDNIQANIVSRSENLDIEYLNIEITGRV